MATGAIHKTNNYGDLEVLLYESQKRILVRFIKTNYETYASAGNIRKGEVKDPLYPYFYGVGFLGVGNYKPGTGGDSIYSRWKGMLRRCYDKSFHDTNPAYKGCSVCNEWHNFQNFAKWFDLNYPKDGLDYDLDKDIKVIGNKVYSPETCTFVSSERNRVAAAARHYSFTSPSGELVSTYNLSEFCRLQGLHRGHMNDVYLGKRKSHQGWTRPPLA